MTDIPSAPPPPSGPPPATAPASPPPAPDGSPPQAAPPPSGGQQDSGQPAAAQGGTGQAAASPPPALPARATALPPELARAPAGTAVEGEVRAVSNGQVTVRTERGDVRLDLGRAQAAQLLRPGTTVTIEIRNVSVRPPVVAVTPRGSAPGAATPLGAGPAVTTGTSAAAPAVPLAVGRIVQATVVPGPGPAAGPTAAGPALAPAAPAPSGQAPAAPAPVAAPGSATTPSAGPPQTPAPPAIAPQTAAPETAAPPTAAPPAASAPVATVSAVPVPATPPPSTAQAVPLPAPPVQGGTAAAVPGPAAAAPAATAPPAPGAAMPSSAIPASASTVASPTPPAASEGSRPGPSAPASAPPAVTAPAAGEARAAALPNGAVLTVRIAAVADEAARLEAAPRAATGLLPRDGPAATPPRISGEIAGVTAAGRPVVQSPMGFLALDARADLRLGTRIALDVLASRGGVPADRSAPLPVLVREWPALEAALRTLEEQMGAAAARDAVAAMPRPGPQLTATLVFFMAALRGGDVRQWLGRQAVQSLEASERGGGLLKALSDDFQTLQRAAEPSEAGWRSFLIPVAWDERRPIRLLTRRERREGRDGRGGKPGTAFLVDLDLTNIGPFRLDGLVREELLDLLIRTTTPLPGVMRRDIKALMDGTLERTGIVGRLSFRASPVMPPLPVDLDATATGDTTTVTV